MKTQVTINGKTIQIELTQEQINQIKNEVTPSKRWRAEDGGIFRFINTHGKIEAVRETNNDFDEWNYNQRNYFKTKEEAQQHLDKLNLIAKIRNRIEELNSGWKPDWEDRGQKKFIISMYYDKFSTEFTNFL